MASIFVGKLDFNASEDQLKSLFEEFGSVTRITIGKDRETGKPKGFAFVEMPNETEANAAVENLNNTEINGRSMAISIAENRAAGTRPANDTRKFDRNDKPQGDYKKSDDKSPRGPGVSPEDISFPKKIDKPKKEADKGTLKDGTKKKKMETYKKSGKSKSFFEDDDEDDLDYRSKDSGWDDDEEE